MDPFVALMRRYVNDYTNRQDVSVCAEIMEPDYTLRMGPHEVAGRDDLYIPASQKQFAQFPGLCLTVHEIVTNGDRLVMRFSEHGRSMRHDGRAAAWGGLGLYRWNGRRLLDNSVEQDYLARRRQLASGIPAAVEPPAVAPWDVVAEPPDRAAESVVRTWLDAADAAGPVVMDDGAPEPLLVDASTEVDDLFSAGTRVAFRVTRTGTYTGGLGPDAGIDDAALAGTTGSLHLVGLVTVTGGRVTGGRIIRDRLGLARSLTRPWVASA
ncbi:ester cyclase [Pseudonocardia parietis]|uniref:Ester cyclase n=1 Tax=Pseudonocardia parietis TaxID=570936 RepID=A0ABS4VWC0_9PSEU|nr:ester cyclase [Pseudonocardia parietis]MBP2367809.1 putative ester cyclase [Pseudonocardia parietis]